MATSPIGADSALVTLPGTIPPAPAVMAILDRFNREELGNTIEVLVALLDIWDGDADAEEGGDAEPLRANGDSDDAAWIEWHAMRGSQKRGANVLAGYTEDDEDDDPAGQYDEDAYTGTAPRGYGAGCLIADSDFSIEDVRHDEDYDMEREQMLGDVPALKVFALEPNPFNGKREYLGRSNMMSTFCVGSPGERSADSGMLHTGRGFTRQPGVPV